MKRDILDKLTRWKEKKERKPLVLRGVRQVGKTYTLQRFGEACFPAMHYLNFEKDEKLKAVFEHDLRPQRIIQEISFYLNKPIDVGRDILIFDEVQSIPRSLTSLKAFAERYRPACRAIFSAKPLSIDRQSGLHRYPLYMAGRFPLDQKSTVTF